jgi:hypothetical protein
LVRACQKIFLRSWQFIGEVTRMKAPGHVIAGAIRRGAKPARITSTNCLRVF